MTFVVAGSAGICACILIAIIIIMLHVQQGKDKQRMITCKSEELQSLEKKHTDVVIDSDSIVL